MGKACGKSARAARTAPGGPRANAQYVRLMEQANQGRIPGLIPLRYGRMLKSPFTFYRGAALNMAADLGARRRPAFACRPAATAILSTLALLPPPNDGSFSTSTTSTSAPRPVGVGPQAPRGKLRPCLSHDGFAGAPRSPVLARVARTGDAWRNTARCGRWRSGTRSMEVEEMVARVEDKEAEQRGEKRHGRGPGPLRVPGRIPGSRASRAGHRPSRRARP